MQTMNGFFDMIRQFIEGNGLYAFSVSACFIYILSLKKRARYTAIISGLILVAGIFNPISFKLVSDAAGVGPETYRIMWCIPFVMLFAYFVYLGIANIKNKYCQLGITVVICVGILGIRVQAEELKWPENMWQIPSTTIEVAEQIDSLMVLQEKDNAVVLADYDVMGTIRQYNAHICFPFSYFGFGMDEVEQAVNEETPLGLMSMLMYNRNDISPKAVRDIVDANHIDYIVVNKNNEVSLSYMQQLNWQIVSSTSIYYILQYQEPEFVSEELSAIGM